MNIEVIDEKIALLADALRRHARFCLEGCEPPQAVRAALEARESALAYGEALMSATAWSNPLMNLSYEEDLEEGDSEEEEDDQTMDGSAGAPGTDVRTWFIGHATWYLEVTNIEGLVSELGLTGDGPSDVIAALETILKQASNRPTLDGLRVHDVAVMVEEEE